jgi:hypothetical protein
MLHITRLLAVPTEELVEAAKADPVLLGVLIGVGVLAALFFVFGIFKQFFKTAVFAGLLSAGVWYWYFNIR